ncbi:MAG TPA: right-handed parallel beta-helix repeat-containing protein [Gemmatimonadaceae bacterium]|jgi:hypothetical protein|nr:right-handed parallel beta-helix repeat-containing protein [Gemmatimonadaceae bacterium]
MYAIASRRGRWPLALTLASVVALAACADGEPTSPGVSGPLRPHAAAGDVFLVTNTNDAGLGSLRWALSFTTGGEIIRFDPSIAGKTIVLDSVLYIRESVTIEGPAGAGITINGGGKERIFDARFTGNLTLRNLSLTGGYSPQGIGGVLYGDANLLVENTAVYGNVGDAGGMLYGGNITLINSTVSNNTTENPQTPGYAAVMGDTVVVINSTIANNPAGGVGSGYGAVTIRNSILANNARENCVIYVNATLAREGANVSDDDTCGGPSEVIIDDPKLAGLADNGGPTMTHALLAGSPAIDAGTSCSVQMDQRFFPRDANCDLGAFEFADRTAVTITIDQTAIVNQQTGWAVLTGTVRCSRDESFKLALELHQDQRVGKQVVDIHSAATEPVACTTVARPWSASMVLTDGSYQNGSARATAYTFETEPWVAPAAAERDVKTFRRK